MMQMALGQAPERFLRPLILPETHLNFKKFKAHHRSWVHFVLGYGLEEGKAKPQTLQSMDHDDRLPPSTLYGAMQGRSPSGRSGAAFLPAASGWNRRRPVLKSISFFNLERGREARQGTGVTEASLPAPRGKARVPQVQGEQGKALRGGRCRWEGGRIGGAASGPYSFPEVCVRPWGTNTESGIWVHVSTLRPPRPLPTPRSCPPIPSPGPPHRLTSARQLLFAQAIGGGQWATATLVQGQDEGNVVI